MPSFGLRHIATISLFLALSACTTTSGHQPTTTRSGFDGARLVNIEPHSGICTSIAGPCINLGAQWSSATPERAFLVVQVSGADYFGLNAASINIDGVVTTLPPSADATDYTTEGGGMIYDSTRSFPVPLSMLQQIGSAHRVWLRVLTPTGTVDGAIIDGDKDSNAYNAIRRFLAQVRQN